MFLNAVTYYHFASPPIRSPHSRHRVHRGYFSYSFSLRAAKKNKPKPCGARFVRQSIAEGMMILVCPRLSDKRKIPSFSAISVAQR
jgi:hypothetical protein